MSELMPVLDLPAAGDAGAESLAGRAWAFLSARDALTTLLTTAGLAGAVAFLPEPDFRVVLWVAVAILMIVSLFVEIPWLNRVQVRTTSYTVTADYVYIVRGRVWRQAVVIATSQILNVEIVQGPLQRVFGIVSIRFTCIADIERLGPLTPAAAERARAIVLGAQSSLREG